LNIKVFCRRCNWTGQAVVGKSISRYSHEQGHPLEDYRCPKCGGSIKRCKGRYNYDSEKAILKGDYHTEDYYT